MTTVEPWVIDMLATWSSRGADLRVSKGCLIVRLDGETLLEVQPEDVAMLKAERYLVRENGRYVVYREPTPKRRSSRSRTNSSPLARSFGRGLARGIVRALFR